MIDFFENQHWLAPLQVKATIATRAKMVKAWFEHADVTSGDSIFDVGATPEVVSPSANCMVRWFLERTPNVTLYSPEDIAHLVDVFPSVKVRSACEDISTWPASDLEFDYVASSAVIEHVGSAESQMAFLREAGRIARKGIFITTPNRWHALEFQPSFCSFIGYPSPSTEKF